MEKKKDKKISLSTFFLILSIIVILVMSIFMFKIYNEKIQEIHKSSELQSQVDSLNETIKDFQEKLDSISETINSDSSISSDNSDKIKDNTNNQTSIQNLEKNTTYDVEVSLSEIENIKSNIDDTEIKAFYEKYKNKTIKVTGYVSVFGDEFYSNLGPDLATGVEIGNSQSYKTKVYVYGVTYNSDIIEKIHKLREGSKVSLIGTLPDSYSEPIEIHLTNIIEE